MTDARTTRTRACGVLFGVIVAALWGSAFSAIELALDEFPPLTLVSLRLSIAAGALLVVGACRRVPLPRRADLPRVFGCATVGMTGYQLLLNLGEVDVPAGTASMIIAAAPLVAAFVVRRDHAQRGSRRWWWASAVCATGVAVVCIDAAGSAPLLAVGSLITAAVVYGLYGPLLKPLLAHQSGLTVTTHVTVAAALLSAPLIVICPVPFDDVTAAGWAAVVYLGVVPSAAAFLLWAESLRRLRTSETIAFLFLVPVFGMGVALVTTGTTLTPTVMIGSVLVLVGLCVALGTASSPPEPRR